MTQAAIIDRPHLADTIVHDGWHIDVETGEILGRADVLDEFRVTDAASAEWVLERYSEVDGALAGIAARRAAVTAQFDKLDKEQVARRAWLDYRFGSDMAGWTATAIEGGKKRSLNLTWGTVGYRKSSGSIKVRTGLMPEAVTWARTQAPEAIKVEEKVLVSSLKGWEATLPATVFDVTMPSDSFYLKTGVNGDE